MESITNGIGSILGQAQNVFTLKTSPSTIDYSKLQNYSVGGVPVITYGLIGITTLVLATITVYESMGKQDNSTDNPSDSMTSLLPTLPTLPTLPALSTLNPLSSPSPPDSPSLDKEPSKSDGSVGMPDLFGGPATATPPASQATGGKKKKTIRRKRNKNKNKTINNMNVSKTKA